MPDRRVFCGEPEAIARNANSGHGHADDDTATITDRAYQNRRGMRTRGRGRTLICGLAFARHGGHLSAKPIHRCPAVSRPVLFVRQTAMSPVFRRKNRQKRPLRTAATRYAERPENDLSVVAFELIWVAAGSLETAVQSVRRKM